MSRRSPFALLVTFLFVTALMLNARNVEKENGSRAQAAAVTNNIYIIQMIDAPVVKYDGSIKGLKATRPKKGGRIDPEAADVITYKAYLDNKHSEAAEKVGGKKVVDYGYVFNGFAAELTPAQAEALQADPTVIAVSKDELQEADTASTPSFLGLTAANGLWAALGGADSAGEGIIIGLIDSGIWPESESFSDRTGLNGNGTKDGKLSYHNIPHWKGKCHPGEAWTATNCNQKLIGARHYNTAFGGDAALKAQRPWEFMSPRDYNGHGTHTSSTAGGNSGVAVSGNLAIFQAVNGIAPRARISMYKALWHVLETGSANGFTSDLVAAIDQAVADGVDVINYSISGSRTNFVDPVSVAFLNAADAGVFVAASAGNSGPTTSTVAHPGPWLTTVAAGTHSRTLEGPAILGNGVSYTGASLTLTGAGPAPLIDSVSAGLAGANALALARCYSSTWNDPAITPPMAARLDPAKVAGKIVLCDRGVNDRVDKSKAVAEAGGIGMILVNTSANNLVADAHSVPTVHLPHTDRPALKAYVAGAGPTARIGIAAMTANAAAPFTASFSSRGPMLAGGGDLLKPDVIAPGVDILAAVAPPGNGGASFASYQGTSMSSPHVAGLAALFKQLKPDWSPMAIKSALMTSAGDILDGPNTNPLVIFRQGAGHVRPNNAMDPGLVFDSNANDWLAFLCGTTTAVVPSACASLASAGYSFNPSDMNTASIAIGDLKTPTETVTRRVTNVSNSPSTYTATVTGMAGIATTVSPASFTINPGQTKSFTVSFSRTTGAFNAYSGGQLTLSDGSHTVRIPMVVRPISLIAPVQVSGTGANITYPVSFGYAGPFTASARGMVASTSTGYHVEDDPANSFTSPAQTGVTKITEVVVPAGTSYVRFALFDASTSVPSDIDLVIIRKSTGAIVAATGGATSNEEANLINPVADTYEVYAHGFEVPAGGADGTLFHWVLGTANAGNMNVSAPSAATTGTTGNITLSFPTLPSGRWLGSVAYTGSTGFPNPTIVRVDKP